MVEGDASDSKESAIETAEVLRKVIAGAKGNNPK